MEKYFTHKYLVINSFLGGDGKYHEEVIGCTTFVEAAKEFNMNCAKFCGSSMLIDIEYDKIIKQCIRRNDNSSKKII